MKIVIDENIKYARELFSKTGNVHLIPAASLRANELQYVLKDADALIIRSVTKVNAELLSGTSIKFVGTATSGIDHVDYFSLAKERITFTSAPGCNAIAVVEYVLSAMFLLAERDHFDLRERTVGIVGVGNIGSCLNKRLKSWGVKTLLCDPPKLDQGYKKDLYLLKDLVSQSDIITFHTPLLQVGKYKSWHLASHILLMSLRPNTILINTSRGSVIDNMALLNVLNIRNDLSVVLDVWENEPNLSIELLNKVDIGTAHIAGHSIEGKIRATIQLFKDWCKFTKQPHEITLQSLFPKPSVSSINLDGKLNQSKLKELASLVYNINNDDTSLRKFITNNPSEFDKLRKEYPERREWSSLKVICNNMNTANLLKALGFSVKL